MNEKVGWRKKVRWLKTTTEFERQATGGWLVTIIDEIGPRVIVASGKTLAGTLSALWMRLLQVGREEVEEAARSR